ncbi:MAG: DUF1820 family protein, partial [Spirochaetaceae bacterium]
PRIGLPPIGRTPVGPPRVAEARAPIRRRAVNDIFELTVSLYRVHLKWNDKDITLHARGLDLTHPYFVSITELEFPEQSNLIIDPAEDEVRKTFGEADHLMIPFQTVTLIEEIKEEKRRPGDKVRNFTVVEGSEEDETDDT